MHARAAVPPMLPEVTLAPGALIVADLHLDGASAEACEPFAAWTRALDGVPQLAILGDLFDVWVGPAQATMAGARLVLEALATLAERGTRVIVVPGNRDFLLDASFERASRASVLPEGFVASVSQRRTSVRAVFVHGDTLCTLDRGYQRLRRTLRSAPVRWIGPRLPLWAGSAIARRLRRASVRAIAAKLPAEKSVQASAARDLARRERAELVVCGHAHAFRDEALDFATRWIVLDAFGGARDVLCVGAEGEFRVEASDVAHGPGR